ncbi:MAG: hypothetical protein ABIS44_02485, partial [Mycobacteriales bacterium]
MSEAAAAAGEEVGAVRCGAGAEVTNGWLGAAAGAGVAAAAGAAAGACAAGAAVAAGAAGAF